MVYMSFTEGHYRRGSEETTKRYSTANIDIAVGGRRERREEETIEKTSCEW